MNYIDTLNIPIFKQGGIHIKKKNRGKFTEYCNGKVTQKCIDKAKRSGNKKLVKRAVFAENSRKWAKKHDGGGYIVKKGDTLSKIAQENNTTVKQLISINGLNSSFIKEGQNLIIPTNDKIIGDTPDYGWTHSRDRGNYDKYKLKYRVDPGSGFGIGDYISNGIYYTLGWKQDSTTNKGNKYDRAFFYRHLGFPRNYNLMPTTQVRFTGDYNEDGTPKRPNAEYVGLSNEVKRFIQEGIQKGYINTDKDGLWTPKKEDWYNRSWTKKTSHLQNYAIRENNGSGIFDVFDTYDFDEAISNRKPGYQIEIRDTIHGPNANPKLYDTKFSTKKAKQIKEERRANQTIIENLWEDLFE